MTHFITALSNDKAQLIVHTMRTTDERAALMIADMWKNQGHKVTYRKED